MTKEEQVVEALEVVEEVKDLVEVADKSITTATDSRDTMQEIVPTPPQYVNIASPMIMLLKNVLFYKISGRKRDHSYETKMSSWLVLRIALCIKSLMWSRKVD